MLASGPARYYLVIQNQNNVVQDVPVRVRRILDLASLRIPQ